MTEGPTLKIIPDGNQLYASETVVNMLTELNRRLEAITEVNDRYREALESIANPYVLDAEAQTWIARAALGLEGEG